KPDRVANWDALHALMSAWSRHYDKQWIANAAQAAHVPSFPLREPAEQFVSPQLEHRSFWRTIGIAEKSVKAPGPPFRLQIVGGGRKGSTDGAGPLPLSDIRVLDCSWVIASPTTTRYLAAMGRRHQDRGAWPRRPWPGFGIAHGSRTGQTKRRSRPQETRG